MAADRATQISLLGNNGDVVQYTVANGLNISRGDILQLLDAGVASKSSAYGQYFAGIAADDKEANDGSTTIGAYTKCVADLKISGAAVTAGQYVLLSGANLITAAGVGFTHASGGLIVGKARETAVGGTAETIEVMIGVL